MKCQSTNLKYNTFVPCECEAVESVWCPTWITMEKGPLHLCAEHAKNFKPEFNKYSSDGVFYWGETAKIEFQKWQKLTREEKLALLAVNHPLKNWVKPGF